jgi:hypothetical protein
VLRIGHGVDRGVTGMGKARFEGYIGYRWGRFFIIIEPALRSAAKVAVGDTLNMVVEPTTTSRALAKAREQSKVTTAPARGRADAIERPAKRARKKPPEPE